MVARGHVYGLVTVCFSSLCSFFTTCDKEWLEDLKAGNLRIRRLGSSLSKVKDRA